MLAITRRTLSGGLWQCLRRALAVPLYVILVILSFAIALVAFLAAKIAGDDWPG